MSVVLLWNVQGFGPDCAVLTTLFRNVQNVSTIEAKIITIFKVVFLIRSLPQDGAKRARLQEAVGCGVRNSHIRTA